ncbi:uncharacterized protein At4g37920, chloroplastic isoform X1 [Ananas comosus]|uniref:Uncharacterized protein At4g37920, chloroplastic isoform X1 n=1 Tax=Ananas comosus TaxID=4615 RepID=A0A6P5EW68_ANACO|nr:uncharacterized protein At4g37920, chloroplastic isoform X1 [Ananas comosus]
MAMASSSALRPSLPLRFCPPPLRNPLFSRTLSCRFPSTRSSPRKVLLRSCGGACSSSFDPGGHASLSFSRSNSSSLAAVGDATAVPSDIGEDLLSSSMFSGNATPNQNSSEDNQEKIDVEADERYMDDSKMIRICDKLIEVFMVDKPTTTDWRRLLAFSREWDNIRPHFFKRCQERADAEVDPEMRHKLLRLGRKLKEIDEDVQRHNELLAVVKGAPSEINSIVAKRCKDFTKEFFVHLHTVAESYYENPEKQNELANLGNVCLAAVQAYDNASESIEALNAAELKLQDIVNSPSLDAACRKIDDLAEKKELDSALMLMLTKAWSAAKESNMMKDEVKDVLYHLYKTAVGNLQRLMPKEIRILKYLLTIEDPEERLSALRDAFIPGDELQEKNVDYLYTTPEALHTWIRTVVDAYNFSREGSLIKEARDLMNPKIIKKLEELKTLIQNNFL